jgi:hypothetical protein
MVASWSRVAYYTVADPRVADLVMLARSLAADNATALADCVRTAPAAVSRITDIKAGRPFPAVLEAEIQSLFPSGRPVGKS